MSKVEHSVGKLITGNYEILVVETIDVPENQKGSLNDEVFEVDFKVFIHNGQIKSLQVANQELNSNET